MRFSFRDIPVSGSSAVRPRPILDVIVEGLEMAPQACLLDSGATAVRLGAHVAELCGVDLTDAPEMVIAVGGANVIGRLAEVALRIADDDGSHEWTAPVWFCDPWYPAFGLLGLTGFFDHFEVTIASYEERIDVVPISV